MKPSAPLDHATTQTPCLVVDLPKMRANVGRMRRQVKEAGIAFRPHLKTAKTHEAALLMMDTPAGPATVSTLKEAEEFGARGVTDLLYAVAVSPQKLERVTALRRSGVDLQVVVDSVEGARAVARHAAAVADEIPALIEVDIDGQRCGVQPDEPQRLVEIGRTLHEGGASLRGVMTHAGGSYGAASPQEILAAASAERAGLVSMAALLREANLPCPVVSVGSTPTALASPDVKGVTEIRAGVFVFFDLFQAGLGTCRIEDIALSVLATVIGRQNRRNWIIVDAGWTALSSDRCTASQPVDQGLGLVCDAQGNPYGDLVVLRANQEHGILSLRPGSTAELPPLKVGDRVRILPNHACATATQHATCTVVDERGEIVDVWKRFNGW